MSMSENPVFLVVLMEPPTASSFDMGAGTYLLRCMQLDRVVSAAPPKTALFQGRESPQRALHAAAYIYVGLR